MIRCHWDWDLILQSLTDHFKVGSCWGGRFMMWKKKDPLHLLSFTSSMNSFLVGKNLNFNWLPSRFMKHLNEMWQWECTQFRLPCWETRRLSLYYRDQHVRISAPITIHAASASVSGQAVGWSELPPGHPCQEGVLWASNASGENWDQSWVYMEGNQTWRRFVDSGTVPAATLQTEVPECFAPPRTSGLQHLPHLETG